MNDVKNTVNGMTGVVAAVATIVSQFTEHVDPAIKLLAGLGGLIVIGMTIMVSYKTAQRTDLERAKLKSEIDALDRSNRSP